MLLLTHLNQFSYPSRLFIMFYATILFATISNFVFNYSWLQAARTRRGIKFWATTLAYIVCYTWMIYDLLTTINSYEVPASSSSAKEGLRRTADALLNITFTCHSSCMFLLMSFWHSMFQSSYRVRSFLKEWEFKAYIVYSILSFAIYPAVQWSLINDNLLFVVVPQMIYLGEMIVSSCLFGVVIYRVNNIRKKADTHEFTRSLCRHLIGLIVMLIIINQLIGWSLGIINISLLVDDSRKCPPEEEDPTCEPPSPSLPLIVKDMLTALFSASYLPLVLLILMLLNIRSVTNMLLQGKKFTTDQTVRFNHSSPGSAYTSNLNSTSETMPEIMDPTTELDQVVSRIFDDEDEEEE